MSNRSLVIGDAVRLYTDDININDTKNARKAIGFVRFIGYIPSKTSDTLHSFTQYVGVELLQKIEKGHDGMVHKTQYFNVEKGFGIHVPIVNIIEVLTVSALMSELKNVLSLLHEKDKYITALEAQQLQYPPHTIHNIIEGLVPIDVTLPTQSARSTFILPAPITPFTPRMSKTNTSVLTRHLIKRSPSSMSSSRSPASMLASSHSTTPNVDAFSGYLEAKIEENQKIHSTSNQYSPSLNSRSPFTPTPVRPQDTKHKRSAHQRKIENKSKRLAMLVRKPVPEFRNRPPPQCVDK